MDSHAAHRIVHEHGLDDRVQKIAADAPEITGPQFDALRGIWLSPDATKPAPDTGAGPVLTDPHRNAPMNCRPNRSRGAPPPKPPCADLEGTFDDLVHWAMSLPFDWFNERLHDVVIQLVNDALDDCYERGEP
jgi:hypothetical protein